jgi:hypothetical protein
MVYFPGRLRLPNLTTAGAPSSPAAGETYFDTTMGCFMYWNGSVWVPGSGPAPAIAVQSVSGQVINNSTFTAVTWNAQADGLVTNPNQYALAFTAGGTKWHETANATFTFPKSGYYFLMARVLWQAATGGTRRMYGQLGTGEFIFGDTRTAPDGSASASCESSAMMRVTAGTTITINVVQSSGAALTLINADGAIGVKSMFMAQWVASL